MATAAARCVRATVPEKIDDRPFPSLRGGILIGTINASKPLEATGSWTRGDL
jgi:hypothetical protein